MGLPFFDARDFVSKPYLGLPRERPRVGAWKPGSLRATHLAKRAMAGCVSSISGVLKVWASSVSVRWAWIVLWQISCSLTVGPPLPPFSFGMRW